MTLPGALVLAAVAVASSPCVAATAANAVEPSFAGGLAQTIFGLAIVLALIWAAAWMLRRLNVGTQSRNSAIRVLASQALGQRERIVLVEVADQWLVLGVAPGRVSALSTLPKGTLPASPSAPAAFTSPFATLLSRARNKGGDASGGT